MYIMDIIMNQSIIQRYNPTKLIIYNNKTATNTNTKKKIVKLHTSISSLSSSLSSGIP